jgi:hypothetical protein
LQSLGQSKVDLSDSIMAAAFGASRPASSSEAMIGFHQVSAIPVRGETIGNSRLQRVGNRRDD